MKRALPIKIAALSITFILISAVLISAFPLDSLENRDTLAFTNETWNASESLGNKALSNSARNVPVTAAYSVNSPKKALLSHTINEATDLTTERANEQFSSLPSSSGRGSAEPKLLTLYSNIEEDNQQQQGTDPSSEIQQSTTGPYPPPGIAPKIAETNNAYLASTTTIAVPGYLWRHGCGPTALGMVLGYYDMQGLDNLYPGDASTQTEAVNQGIASQRSAANPGHYEDYSLPDDSGHSNPLPDRSEPPAGDEHAHDSIADFMKTSWSSENNFYGWSWSSHMGPAFVSYVDLRTPWVSASYSEHRMGLSGNLDWNLLTNEIDNNRPMIFLVDTDANGGTDHFVTVVGYRDVPSQQYGCLDTWSPVSTIRWCDFEEMAPGQDWGIWGGWSFLVEVDSTAPTVEITTNDGNDFSTDETQIVLEGIAFDPEPASELDSVTISTGGPNEGTLSNWLFTVDLNDGPNLLTVTATDRAGNSASDTIIITRSNSLQAHFQADKTLVDIEELVTFENLTTGGVLPYTKAEWDFDADSVIDTTLIGTHDEVMANVTWLYGEPGVYNVSLRMTDSSPDIEEAMRIDYVVAIGCEVVTFPDPNLEAAIREAIDKPTGDICQSDLDGLTVLDASDAVHSSRDITDITGLEHCTSLTELELSWNLISDISPLSTLTGLTYLDLGWNQISDISPLSTLTSLTELDLGWNQISDISPLSTLTSLTELDLRHNEIGVPWGSDMSSLSLLTSLTRLELDGNQINNISPLSSLTSLTYLDLWQNSIDDISPLSSLTSLTYLRLWQNQIGNISPLSSLASLIELDLNSNQIGDISPLSSLTSLTRLELYDNQISDISPLSSLVNLTRLGLGQNQIVNIPPLSSLTSLTRLDLGENQISDTSPLSDLDILQYLELDNNQIGNISPLSSLTSLTYLGLWQNQISDISPLSTLTNLASLGLRYNQINDISPLSSLANLESLGLRYNQINDISPLSSLTSLFWLELDGNQINNISPLSSLTSLAFLYLGENQISDTSPLSDLDILLQYLYLNNNQISDISPLSGLTRLHLLNLEGNQISDIKPLVDNPGLADGDQVDLSCNPLSVVSLNTYIPQLEDRGVDVTNEVYGLNPQFQADKTLVDTGEVVTFQNLTTCGTNPYTMAEWDFDADGVMDLTLTGTEAQVTANVTYAYSSPGVYNVSLRMTDSAPTITEIVMMDYMTVISCEVVTFPDPNLEAAIRDAIERPIGDICQSDLDGLTYLDASDRDIVYLTGLEYCPDLIELDLDHNQIGDILSLSSLTSLMHLNLWDNQIGNISPLSSLTGLTELSLRSNQIYDISPLSALSSLTELYLDVNDISDISPLSSLTSLIQLYLRINQIGNVSPLSTLTSLTLLDLRWNDISDISPLSSLTSLTSLDLAENQISDLSPLSTITSLTELVLHYNQISDVSPLSTLASLTSLWLGDNQISDISPLSSLTSLQWLSLYSNEISEMSPLSSLTSLTWLQLGGNRISEISPLSSLSSLRWLFLGGNQISDISPLSSLTSLTELALSSNQISDIKPLVVNPGLSDGDRVYLSCNPLSVVSLSTYIPQLEDRGVDVTNQVYGLNPQFQADKTLIDIDEVVTFENLTTCGTHPYTMAEWDFDADGIVDLTLTGTHAQVTANVTYAYSTPGVYNVSLRMTDSDPDIEETVRMDYVTVISCEVVTFPDPNLEAAIREAIGKPIGDICQSDLDGLTYLDASYRSINDLAGLEYCINLTCIYLSDNNISDLSPLSTLTSLTTLYLNSNQINDLSPLSTLTSLTQLYLYGNQIINLSPLSTLTSLTFLYLPNNQIGDISPLSTLTSLTTLYLWDNQIGNVSPLSTLNSLQSLYLQENQISDISPLSPLTSLTLLYLWDNQISDISPLSPLTNLTWLSLEMNQIEDISPLSGLTGLTWLNLGDNQIGNISPLSSLTSLTDLDLRYNQISDIAPLSTLTGLTHLGLLWNEISDIAPLSTLTNLTYLYLDNNQISDISSLSTLINLTHLLLRDNQISDVLPLSTLTSLTFLALWGNQISDISPLSTLSSLTYLDFGNNQISDIWPLSTLTSLTYLYLNDNQISDISPLSTLSSLTHLVLDNNQISDIWPLSTLSSLTHLYLDDNQISDIKSLVDNPGLSDGDHVDLSCNPLSVVSVNTYVPQLEDRGVDVTNEVDVNWLNPQFQAVKTLVDIDQVVTFENLTTCGTHPYTMAQWDFDADGVVDLMLTGTEAQVMANVTYSYSTPGVYNVSLRMTDRAPNAREELRIDYIEVIGNATEVWISPPSQTVNTGPFTIDVVVDPTVPIAGVQFDISFNSTLIEAVSVTEGPLLGLSGCPTFFWPPTINNSAGTITGFAGTALGTGCSVSTVGTFATINFTADHLDGISPLDLLNVKVVDLDGNPVPIVVYNGEVEVDLTPWDVNDDGCVDISDLVLVAQHWGETGLPGWIPEDANDDGVIDISDLVIVAQHWGEGCGG